MTAALGELGSVFISVVPSLAGSMLGMREGGAMAADEFAKVFSEKAKDQIASGFRDLPSSSRDAFRGMGGEAASVLMAGFNDAVAGKMPDLMAGFDVFEKGVTHMVDVAGTISGVGIPFVLAMNVIKPFFDTFKALGGEFSTTMLEIGDSYLEASRKIAGSTLGTGQIQQLTGAVRDIMASGAVVYFNDVTDAIGRLNTNIQGLDLQQLEQLTTTMAEAEELVGKIDVTQFSGVLNAWGIGAADADEELTKLVNIARATGIEFNTLTSEMQRSGPAMRQLGYDADQTAMFFAQMTQQGERGTRLIFGMNDIVKKLNELVEKGTFKNVKEGWDDVIVAVQQYIAAGNQAGALNLLDQYTSPQSATLLLEDIQKGIVSINKAGNLVINTSQNLSDAVEQTKNLGDAFRIVGEQIKAALEPVGAEMAHGLVEAGSKVSEWLRENQGKVAVWGANVESIFLQGMMHAINFGVGALQMFAPFLEVIKDAIAVVADLMGGVLKGLADLGSHLPGSWGKAFQAMKGDLNEIPKIASKVFDFDLSGNIDKFSQKFKDFVDKNFPEWGAKLKETAEDFAALNEVSDAFLENIGGKTKEAFQPLKDAQGNIVSNTEGIGALQLLGSADQQRDEINKLHQLGIDIMTNTQGVVTAINFANQKAKETWDKWWEKEKQDPKVAPVQIQPQDASGKPIDSTADLVPAGSATITITPQGTFSGPVSSGAQLDPTKSVPLASPQGQPGVPVPQASVTSAGGAVPLVQTASGTWTSPNAAWAHLIQRESGGSPTIVNTTDSNAAAGDPSVGLFQITGATWAKHGGTQFAASAGQATPQQQAIVAARILQANPSGSDWGAGMGGRENAAALLAGISGGQVPITQTGFNTVPAPATLTNTAGPAPAAPAPAIKPQGPLTYVDEAKGWVDANGNVFSDQQGTKSTGATWQGPGKYTPAPAAPSPAAAPAAGAPAPAVGAQAPVPTPASQAPQWLRSDNGWHCLVNASGIFWVPPDLAAGGPPATPGSGAPAANPGTHWEASPDTTGQHGVLVLTKDGTTPASPPDTLPPAPTTVPSPAGGAPAGGAPAHPPAPKAPPSPFTDIKDPGFQAFRKRWQAAHPGQDPATAPYAPMPSQPLPPPSPHAAGPPSGGQEDPRWKTPPPPGPAIVIPGDKYQTPHLSGRGLEDFAKRQLGAAGSAVGKGLDWLGQGAKWDWHALGFQKGGSTDTIPAMLTPGEYIVRADQASKHRGLLDAINYGMKGYQQGGPVSTAGASMPALDTQGAQIDTIAISEAIAQTFGITDIHMYSSPDGFNEHASGEAADIMVGSNTALGNAVRDYALANAAQFGVEYALWQQTQWNPNGTTSQMGDRGSPTQNHMDHVHIRTKGGGFPQGGGAGAQGYAAPSTGETSNTPAPGAAAYLAGKGFPLATQSAGVNTAGASGGGMNIGGYNINFGGGGAGGGQQVVAPGSYPLGQTMNGATLPPAPPGGITMQQYREYAEQFVQYSQRGGDLAAQQSDAQTKVTDAHNDWAAKLQTYNDLAAKWNAETEEQRKTDTALNAKVIKAKQDLDAATTTLKNANQRAADVQNQITDRDIKGEPVPPKPSGRREGDKDAETLGKGLIKGIFQELGFPDKFGKPFTEWGSWKTGMGLLGFFMGLGKGSGEGLGLPAGMTPTITPAGGSPTVTPAAGGSPATPNIALPNVGIALTPGGGTPSFGAPPGPAQGAQAAPTFSLSPGSAANVPPKKPEEHQEGGLAGYGPTVWGEGSKDEGLGSKLASTLHSFTKIKLHQAGGSAGTDEIPALLTPGEYVHNVAAVQTYGLRFMNAINKRLINPAHIRYQEGGPVDLSAMPAAMASAPALGVSTAATSVNTGPVFHQNFSGVMGKRDADSFINHSMITSTRHTPSMVHPSLS